MNRVVLMMDSEYIKSVAYYADCLITLLLECESGDFVDAVCNCVLYADKSGLDDLIAYAED